MTALLSLCACAHKLTPEQEAAVKRGDCAELLRAADAARAQEQGSVAEELVKGCGQSKLTALVSASGPADALLWCGRAKAAHAEAFCDAATVAQAAAQLHPKLTVGPPDRDSPIEPSLAQALKELGPDYNLAWDADDPDVIVGRLGIAIEHATNTATAVVADAKGVKQRVPATQHRFVARAEGQVELAGKTRVLRASEEARDLTWPASPRLAVAAKLEPDVPAEAELKRRAALAWVRALVKALAAAPPEGVDVSDRNGCVAYGLSLNLVSGDPFAAANGLGDPAKVGPCEKMLDEPQGAGIPVP
jgi:hypothetical protein